MNKEITMATTGEITVILIVFIAVAIFALIFKEKDYDEDDD
jgi:uncharacterized membrane protein